MTIKDLAKNLNVSYSTVSKCLNNDPKVSEKTRQRVLEEARRTGFTFNENARGLATRKTNRIGILFSNNFNSKEYRWFFGQLETYSTRTIEEQGFDFFLQLHKNIRGESNIVRMVNGGLVDGLVIFSRNVTEEEYQLLEKKKFPCTYCYYNPVFLTEDHPNLFWDDDELGGYMATKYLIEHGHRKILTIRADDYAMKMYESRTQGYYRAMQEYDLVPCVVEIPMTFRAARALVQERYSFIREFTALFVQQDQPALSIMQQLQFYNGLRIPEDISIIGYNNIDMIGELDLPLDSMADPMEQVIRSAILALVKIIRKEPENEIRKRRPELVVRGSVRTLEA